MYYIYCLFFKITLKTTIYEDLNMIKIKKISKQIIKSVYVFRF